MKLAPKSIYIDVCALGRSYDDQSFPRIQIEKAAMDVIIAHVKFCTYQLYYSPVHEIEIAANPDEIAHFEIMELLYKFGKNAAPFVKEDYLSLRVKELISKGLGSADAFHAAYAEKIGAYFVTCDDGLLRKFRKMNFKIWYGNPDDFCRIEGLL